MMHHKIRGHVAVKMRYKGEFFKMKIKMCDDSLCNEDGSIHGAIHGYWIDFIKDNGIAMHSTVEDGVEFVKTVKVTFYLHTETVKEYALMFDVYECQG